MMESLDAHLAACEFPPSKRTLRSLRLVSMRLGLSGTHLLPNDEQRGAPFCPSDLLWRVRNWYQRMYGTGTHTEFSPGSVVFRMRGSLWRLRFPKVFGSVRTFADRNLANEGVSLQINQPCTHNILCSVVDLTQDLAAVLTDEEIDCVSEAYIRGYPAMALLANLPDNQYLGQARVDYRHSIEALMADREPNMAKWQTAQAAEKTIKGFLDMGGHPFSTSGGSGHNIVELGQSLNKHFATRIDPLEFELLHCPTKVRYADIEIERSDAFDAHVAFQRLLNKLTRSLRVRTLIRRP